MINWKSILSSFNDKPTLLEWLKLIEKALKDSVLTAVLTDTKDGKTAFIFKFEDGTEITTNYIQTQGEVGPQGPAGPAGPQGPAGPKGDKGDNGVSITGIDTVGNEVAGDNTLTTLRAHYSNNTTDEFIVTAKNGKDSGSAIYSHIAYLYDNNQSNYIYFKVYSHKQALTLNDVLAEIPTVTGNSLNAQKRTYVCFNDSNTYGVVAAGKNLERDPYILVDGVVHSANNLTVVSKSFSIGGFGSQLLG